MLLILQTAIVCVGRKRLAHCSLIKLCIPTAILHTKLVTSGLQFVSLLAVNTKSKQNEVDEQL